MKKLKVFFFFMAQHTYRICTDTSCFAVLSENKERIFFKVCLNQVGKEMVIFWDILSAQAAFLQCCGVKAIYILRLTAPSSVELLSHFCK